MPMELRWDVVVDCGDADGPTGGSKSEWPSSFYIRVLPGSVAMCCSLLRQLTVSKAMS